MAFKTEGSGENRRQSILARADGAAFGAPLGPTGINYGFAILLGGSGSQVGFFRVGNPKVGQETQTFETAWLADLPHSAISPESYCHILRSVFVVRDFNHLKK